MNKKSSHLVDVLYNIIRICFIVGILVTVTGYYMKISQRDTIVIQGLPDRSSASDFESPDEQLPEKTSGNSQTEFHVQPTCEPPSNTQESPVAESADDPNEPDEPYKPDHTDKPDEPKSAESVPEPAEIDIAQLHTQLGAGESSSKDVLININTASAYKLTELDGIGEVKAEAIVRYREENGKFTSVDELLNVKGIGEKTLEKIRDRITVK